MLGWKEKGWDLDKAKWQTGHVIHMNETRIPQELLYGELS